MPPEFGYMTEILVYARDVAEHFLVEMSTVQGWFRKGILEAADDAPSLSGQWVTTWDKVFRLIGFEALTLDQTTRCQLMRPPVTAKELSWLLSSAARSRTSASIRKHVRRQAAADHSDRFLPFKIPGSKALYFHRFQVDQRLKRATDRNDWLRTFPRERKPSK
jgi:hypothetical protein